MAQNTFPAFTNMIPTVEDIQLIVDSLRQEDRYRTTKDGIFTPGIVNEEDTYLQPGTNENSLKIKPFIAYTANGNRIEVSDTWDNLYAQGNVISVSNDNLVSEYENIPVWYSYVKTYESFTDLDENNKKIATLTLTELGRGSILHGIKLRTNAIFASETESDIFISIGTESEPEKFLPPTLISSSAEPTNLSVMNLMYSINDSSTTKIVATFTSESVDLDTLTNGSLTANLCIANLSGFDNEDLTQTEGGYELGNSSIGSWQPSTRYHIVVRYVENPSNYRQLNYTTLDGTEITTTSEATRYTTNYGFYALRKTGSIIDFTTLDDVKLGEIVTGVSGNIISININGKNSSGDDYTQYLSLPGYRFKDGINASQIGDGTVSNTEFSYLNGLTSNIQSQLLSKAGLKLDNTFTGINTFEEQIIGSIEKVNGFSANATPAANSLLVLDENGKIPADALSESTVASIGNFYTVSNGVTTNGRSSFLSPNSGNTGVIVTASSDNPLVLNYPDGSVEKITTNQELRNLDADGYYYLVKEQDGNFAFLPTSGGTMACIPVVGSNNNFNYLGTSGGKVTKTFNGATDLTAYKAFDGTLSDGTTLGSVTYLNYNNIEQTSYLPSTATSLIVHFPVAVTPTSFSACFRMNYYDVDPKAWQLQGTNDDYTESAAVWTTLTSNSTETWDIGQIKSFAISDSAAYKNFRFIFNVNNVTVNNHMIGESTDEDGVTMPINCYYFQIYATNTDTSIKGNIEEGYVKPSGMSVGSYFLDISKKPYTGYKCTGQNTFTEVNYVKL